MDGTATPAGIDRRRTFLEVGPPLKEED